MAITLLTGPANAGKAHVVMDRVRRELAHGEHPMLVVPTRADAEQYQRELAGEGAVMGLRVERFRGLIGEVVRRAGVARPALSGLARERLLATLAARERGEPASPGYLRTLGEVIGELRLRRVSPARLTQALGRSFPADGGLGRLYGAYDRALVAIDRLDEEDRARSASSALSARSSSSRWSIATSALS